MVGTLLSLMVWMPSFLGAPRVNLKSGAKASFRGKGPPVVVSTGLYGSMPTLMYSELIRNLQSNLTVVTVNKPFLTAETLEEVADAIGVDQVGFLSHSSFDAIVLSTAAVKRAVL